VLARSLALAAAALGVAALSALSMKGSPTSANLLLAGPVVVRLIFFSQLVLLGLLSRYVERLAMIPAAVLLFSYAAFCGMEFSVLFSPATLAVALLCGGLMYGATALWGYLRGCDLAHPITPVIMILGGGLTLACLNQALGTPKLAWSLSAVVVVLFAVVEGSHAQQVRDLYQDFDDDNAQGWKASVVGASLLVVNSLNLYVLATTFLGRFLEEETQPQRRSERF
jgi:FtsH-binding integral membrane protein